MSDDEQRPPGDRPGDQPDVGSVGEEAAKLLGVLSAWAGEHAPDAGADRPDPGPGGGFAGLAGQAADAVRDLDAHLATDDPECRWCPVCRTVHLVRACTPEVRDQLAGAAAELMRAAAGLLASASAPDQRDRGSHGVQHIDLDDDPGASGPAASPEGPGRPDTPGRTR